MQSSAAKSTETLKHMQCMEVWGGNRSVDSGVIMPGVDAWVFSQPYQNEGAGAMCIISPPVVVEVLCAWWSQTSPAMARASQKLALISGC